VSRTLQEFSYFNKTETKDLLSQLLFIWGRENPDYGYKQGMNEILAMVVIVFDTERTVLRAEPRVWDNLSDEDIASLHLVEYLFDPESNKADIYACYDRILQLGIKYLYMDTKDITELKKARMLRNK
jgi:TBC1 domain family protein 5